MKRVVAIILGFCAGVFSGLLGLGGAIILIPTINYLSGYAQQKTQGTAMLVMLPTVLVGIFSYYTLVKVDYSVGFPLIVGSLLTVYIGVRIANIIQPHILKRMFGVFLFVMAIRLFLK